MAHDITPPTPTPAPATPPAGADNLAHLQPDRLQIGDPGVFAGSWAWNGDDPDTMRIPVGYLGRLEDWWNGWAVWSTTRDIVDALVAEQHRRRRIEWQQLVAEGYAGAELADRLDGAFAPMYLDGTDLIVDEHANGDDDPLVRNGPDHEGRYTPMGWHWTWIPVDPTRCDRIIGHLPPSPTPLTPVR